MPQDCAPVGDKVGHGLKLADDAAAALEKIKAQRWRRAVESVHAIAAATREQQAARSPIARKGEHIAQTTGESAASVSYRTESARELKRFASVLRAQAARFTL
jgi:methyl-accepting chemotaxis protein